MGGASYKSQHVKSFSFPPGFSDSKPRAIVSLIIFNFWQHVGLSLGDGDAELGTMTNSARAHLCIYAHIKVPSPSRFHVLV